MSNSINIKDWKTYKISNMFDVSYGKFIPRCDSESNGVPHITTTTMNNGVGYFVKNAMFPAGCITVASDGNMGASYYQDEPYSASNIVSSLIPKNKTALNKYTAEFICSLLRKIGANYSWEGYKFSVQRVKDTMLPLPSIRKIKPDFACLNTIIGGGIDMSKIDTSSWKEFKLADIAKLENGNKLDAGKMTQLSPSINFVSRTAKNNGVSNIVDKIEGIEPYPAGCLTLAFGGSVGSCFLQERPFYTGQNVGVIMFSEEISLEAKKYIATSLGNKCKLSYQAFGNEINRHFKTDLSVKLPAIETYEPDWQYMEEYMKNIESEVTSKIDKFQIILGNEKHKIDTQKWGGYRIGDLFDIERGKVKGLQQKETGTVPVIAAARQNQGIAGFYNVESLFENKITISCNGAGCGSTFYHPYKFNINGDAIVLSEKIEISDSVKQFIACILDATFIKKYSYEEKCSADKAKNELIKLPTSIDGNPDWDYMEKYMKDIENKVIHYIDSIECIQPSDAQ